MRKIAFFDIDGTLTSEIDGSIPESAIAGARQSDVFKYRKMFSECGATFS